MVNPPTKIMMSIEDMSPLRNVGRINATAFACEEVAQPQYVLYAHSVGAL